MMITLLALLLAQAPTRTDATVALQSVQATAILLKLPARDLTLVKTDVTKTLKAMKAQPDQARGLAAECLIRLRQRIGSASYEQLHPYLSAAELVVGPPALEHAKDANGKPIPDDQ